MLLIMAFIGTIAPTLFYQTYGSVCYRLVLCVLVYVLTEMSSSSSFVMDVRMTLRSAIVHGFVNTVTTSIQILSMIRSTNRL